MTIGNLYKEAVKHKYKSLILLIDFLVFEKKKLQMTDSKERLDYYMQAKWKDYINKHLQEYARKRVDLFGEGNTKKGHKNNLFF